MKNKDKIFTDEFIDLFASECIRGDYFEPSRIDTSYDIQAAREILQRIEKYLISKNDEKHT